MPAAAHARAYDERFCMTALNAICQLTPEMPVLRAVAIEAPLWLPNAEDDFVCAFGRGGDAPLEPAP
jgi:hypothetical protein